MASKTVQEFLDCLQVNPRDCSRPRMVSAVYFAEAFGVDVGVYLGRADVRMAEKLLDRPYVGTVGEHVRVGKGHT